MKVFYLTCPWVSVQEEKEKSKATERFRIFNCQVSDPLTFKLSWWLWGLASKMAITNDLPSCGLFYFPIERLSLFLNCPFGKLNNKMWQKWCSGTFKASSKEALHLPSGSLEHSGRTQLTCQKSSYPETTMLEKPLLGTPMTCSWA